MVDSTLPKKAPTTGQLLASFPRIFGQDTVTLRQVLNVLGDRGLASALLAVTIPQFLPLPLGLSNLMAIPIVLVAAQMALGRHSLWLPDTIMERPVRRDRMVRAMEYLAPWLMRVEKMVRPRLWMIWSPVGLRCVGISCLAVSLVSLTPLPLTGWLPALSLAIMAFGLLERDGLVVLLGLGVGVAALGLLAGVVLGLFEVGERVLDQVSML